MIGLVLCLLGKHVWRSAGVDVDVCIRHACRGRTWRWHA